MVTKKASPIFASKEDSNFREALSLYDSKQYKKALKLVDANLKKHSNHAESLALKGCIIFQTNGNKDDARSYIDRAAAKNPNNYLVDHLIGLYYRANENYAEAAKWLSAAMENGSTNKAILRDLSFMQIHIRDYKNLRDSRQQYLEHAPGYRANWTGVAVAHHLNKDYASAVGTLAKIEDIIKDHLTESDMYEQSECVLYKNQLIGESGDFAKALDVLQKDDNSIKDRLSFLEYKAKYLLLLGQKKEASLVYRELLKRNPDNVSYYNLLETALGTTTQSPEIRYKLYQKLSKFYPHSDPPKFLPLTFLPSDSSLFEKAARNYIIPQLLRGVPATFVNVKPLYKNPAKLKVIESIVKDFYEHDVPKISNPTVKVWTCYYFAQHYLYQNDLTAASKYIDIAIEHSPTLVELYIIKARIIKHQGDFVKASDVMNEGRLLDLQDRFINSKSTKYLLRANKVNEAIDCISLFTKLDENAVNGCKDLHTMQANWVLEQNDESFNEIVENTEIYRGLALKRFHAVLKNFDIFYNDQFDFHSYCLRRGTPRDYIDTLKWEDKIHTTPIYTRALKGLSELYFEIYEEQQQQQQKSKADENDAVVVKKNSKKQKKAKSQLNKKRAELVSKVESEKDDADPFGIKLYHDLIETDVLESLFELFKPLSEEGKNLRLTWEVLFRIYLLQGKYVLALQAIKSLNKILTRGDSDKKLKQIGEMVLELSTTVTNDSNANVAIVKVVEKGLNSAFPDFEKLSCDEFAKLYNQ
ncbi:NMDA receptor-regulated protein 1 family protein [Candida albicans]|uniref:NMDA receptor-regulated protein 1 family protein n=1 Tax=Candida albicans TaxID=5476 RepID=A0A8H6BT48_CANAX|nr:NMDA receptor-regulated protein 1 family protein [Candida albicans]